MEVNKNPWCSAQGPINNTELSSSVNTHLWNSQNRPAGRLRTPAEGVATSVATPAGRSGCEPKTECPRKTLRNDKMIEKKKGKQEMRGSHRRKIQSVQHQKVNTSVSVQAGMWKYKEEHFCSPRTCCWRTVPITCRQIPSSCWVIWNTEATVKINIDRDRNGVGCDWIHVNSNDGILFFNLRAGFKFHCWNGFGNEVQVKK